MSVPLPLIVFVSQENRRDSSSRTTKTHKHYCMWLRVLAALVATAEYREE